MNTLFEELKTKLDAACPRCHSQDVEASVEPTPGAVGMAWCNACGWKGECMAQPVRREIFEWNFDNGSHTIFWDATSIIMLIPFIKEHVVEVDIPAWLVKAMIEENNASDELGDQAESLSPDKPIIMIEHPTSFNVPIPYLPIDGWHRLYMAYERGQGHSAIIVPRQIEMEHRIMDIIHVGYGDHAVYSPKGKPSLMEVMEAMSDDKVMLPYKRRAA